MRFESIQKTVLAVALFLSFLAGLGSVPLFDKDEGAFCEATREMVASGNYLMTYLNGVPRYDKPILIYWLQAACVHVFGLNEFAVRLPSAVSAVVWTLLIYCFTRRVLDADKAFLAAFFMATTAQITVIGKAAIADSLLNLCIAAAMFALYVYRESGHRRFLYLGALAIGLGTLTKGPMAFLVPVAATILFCAWQRDLRRWIRGFASPVAWAIFLAVTIPWFVAAYLDQGEALLDAWFKHTVGRSQGAMEGHSGPFFYYVPVLIIGLIPYPALLLWSAGDIRRRLGDPLTRFCLTWFGFVFVLMSCLATKLPHYIIYGYTPLFILMARALGEVEDGSTPRRIRDILFILPALLFAGFALALPALVPYVASRTDDPFAAATISLAGDAIGTAYYPVCGLALAAVAATVALGNISTRAKLAVAGFAVICVVNFAVLPVVAEAKQAPVREAALIAKEHDYEVYVWGIQDVPSFVFYREALVHEDFPPTGSVLLTKEKKLQFFPACEVLYRKGGIALVRMGER